MFNREREDFSFYRYGGNAEKLKNPNGLEWNVIIEDWNLRKMIVHNVFNHYGFLNDLIDLKKKMKKDETIDFEETVRRSLFYYYGSKSEWEFVATSWPPYVENEEIDRLVKEREDRTKERGNFLRTDVDLTVGTKLDVYTQVRMNWVPFIQYLKDNWNLVKKPKN